MTLVWRISAALTLVAFSSAARAQWTVTDLHPAGATESRAHGVSGQQQVGRAKLQGMLHASQWSGSAQTWIDMHPIGQSQSQCWGIDDGTAVGATSTSLFDSPFSTRAGLWKGSPASFVSLHPANAHASVAYAIEGTRQVGAAAFSSPYLHAVTWNGTATSCVDMHPVSSGAPTQVLQSEYYGVGDGQLVGYWFRAPTPPLVMRGTELAGGILSDITPTLPESPSEAIECNIDSTSKGEHVGYIKSTELGQRAYLWKGTETIDLSPVGSASSWGQGIWRGQQVGYATFSKQHAGIWSGSADTWVDLHAFLPQGFVSSTARGIWSDRFTTSVVGWGANSTTGRTEALLWTRASCWPDLTHNELVDDEDFSLFAGAYDEMICPHLLCPADLNDDGVVDDADFVIFVVAYEAMLCP